MFYCVESRWEDPARNLAAEEFLLRQRQDDFVMFYINAPSVIVGKHQNVFREVNLAWTARKGIPVIRRLTGGGTVYHDRGNLNFSFILSGEKGKLVDFAKYIRPVTAFLRELGVAAVTDEHNNILIGGKKISGNAEHIFKDRVLHHGTLLFDTVPEDLAEALHATDGEVRDRAISSRRSKVTNIRAHLEKKIQMDEFRKNISDFFRHYFSPCADLQFTAGEIAEIEKLAEEKYSSWEWNIAYSPSCILRRALQTPAGTIMLEVSVERGRMAEITCPEGEKETALVAAHLKGLPFRYEEVEEVLGILLREGKLSVISLREWLFALFGY
jgi:lipoate-protein ligase A